MCKFDVNREKVSPKVLNLKQILKFFLDLSLCYLIIYPRAITWQGVQDFSQMSRFGGHHVHKLLPVLRAHCACA